MRSFNRDPTGDFVMITNDDNDRGDEVVKIEDKDGGGMKTNNVMYDGWGVTTSSCVFNDQRDRCITHSSAVEKVKVTSKKWRWKPGQQKYGFVASKEVKFICTGRGFESVG